MIFGNKEEFGLEIEFQDNKKYAHILLYISNMYIGTKDDITYVKSFFASLESRVVDSINSLPQVFLKLTPKEIAQELFHNKYFESLELSEVNNPDYDLLDKLRISNLEDTFDVFDMMAYLDSENNITFCWEVDFEYHNDENYPAGIHCKKLNYSYVKNVINESIQYVKTKVDYS